MLPARSSRTSTSRPSARTRSSSRCRKPATPRCMTSTSKAACGRRKASIPTAMTSKSSSTRMTDISWVRKRTRSTTTASNPARGEGPAMGTMKLYYFEGYDFRDDKVLRSKRPATMEFIDRYHLRAVDDNAVEVDDAQVDA